MFYIFSLEKYFIYLCFVMTINKLYSQFLKTVKVHLKIFTLIYSQLYIVLSQIISTQRVIILFSKNSNKKTNNKVYSKILF